MTNEEKEEILLAPYAMKTKYSKGRKYSEIEDPYRSAYQRDKDRIIHSSAFRRLEYKTQVFVNHEGDYYRTRLTHTIEVNQIARTIAKALNVNEDLVDAISLAHDIGHTPFGHAGEEALNELMKEQGGFEHNLQGLRVVDVLEKRYPNFTGLNLTYETREGIIKHSTIYNKTKITEEFGETTPTIEAQIINVADEIAYNSHDLDDGIKSEYIDLELLNEVTIWREIYNENKKKYKNEKKEIWIYRTISEIINKQVVDIITNTKKMIEKYNIKSIEDVKYSPTIVVFSDEMKLLVNELKQFLYNYLYCHYKVVKMCQKAKRYIEALFTAYIKDIRQLPEEYRKYENKYRAICDYIGGMTDRFAQDEYERLFLPYTKM